jgi:hypothetical protein
VIYGVEGKNFEPGLGLSPEVAAAAKEIASRVKKDLRTRPALST